MVSRCEDPPRHICPAAVPDIPESELVDPPPPYPEPHRRQYPPSRTHNTVQPGGYGQGHVYHNHPLSSYSDEDDGEANEDTPFLISGRQAHIRSSRHSGQRTSSETGSASTTVSLTQTLVSLFQEDEREVEGRCTSDGVHASRQHHHHQSLQESLMVDGVRLPTPSHAYMFSGPGISSCTGWETYFRPLQRWEYYKALLHLLFINLPYALIAWIYLFTLTVTGTTLLIALPLGALLLFFDLLGARTFALGEVHLQTRFHGPHLPIHVRRPLFTRYREATVEETERGRANISQSLIKERSFYKNTYAMFSDPTSYQAVFYFLIVKPAITLLITLALLVLGVPLLILIVPAPGILRAVRKIGIWQASIAVEGLCYAVR